MFSVTKLKKKVSENFHVDEIGYVYDDMGIYYCKWSQLSITEQNIISGNSSSILPTIKNTTLSFA